jgi:HrpA-like RNA helicase
VEVLTPLGRLLALLPLEPRLGKLLVMGAALGCLAPTLVSAGWSKRNGVLCLGMRRVEDCW